MTIDLSALFSFTSIQRSGPGPDGDGTHYRDLQNYYYEKRHALVRSGKRVDATVKEALAACGLDSTDTLPTRLNQRGYEKKAGRGRGGAGIGPDQNDLQETPCGAICHAAPQER